MQDDFLDIKIKDWNHGKEMKICILSIIQDEIFEIINTYKMSYKQDNYIYWEGSVEGETDILIHLYQQNESGNLYSQQLMGYVLEKDYDYYFCVGTSGAVKIELYDVIIANQVIYMEKGTNTVCGKEYDGKAIEITESEKNKINTFLASFLGRNSISYTVKAAPIFSGESVEKNPQADELKKGAAFARKLAAIDMESFGLFQAVRFMESFGKKEGKPVFIIRGVSDKADKNKNAFYDDGLNAKERKSKAMKNVVEVLTGFILFLKNFDR